MTGYSPSRGSCMKRIVVSLVCLLTAACSGADRTEPRPAGTTAATAQPLPKIDQNAILERIKVLSSDQFEGRAPGTKGEELTVQYLVDESKKLGLQPGNPDGTYVQKVPLVGITGSEA